VRTSHKRLPATSYVTMEPEEAERLWKIEALVRRNWELWLEMHGGDREAALRGYSVKGREVIDLLEGGP
jgi:hypothetical protein